MNEIPEHDDAPAEELSTDEIRELLADALRKAYRENIIEPWRLYAARQIAFFPGLENHETVCDVPEAELARCWVGPDRGSLRFTGADMTYYVKQLEPINYEGVIEELRQELRRPSHVRPIPSGKPEKRRII